MSSEDKATAWYQRTLTQLVRFGVVGVLHNVFFYLLYLLVTWLGTDPMLAVAMLYPLATLVSYFMNRHWTFAHRGQMRQSMSRYIAMHVLGYLLNLGIIAIGVDYLNLTHQYVQLFAIVFLAALFFLLSKFFIFKDGGQTGRVND